MNSLFKNLMGLALILLFCVAPASAQEIMAILSDDLRPVSTNYVIYPETSNLIAQQISNKVNLNNHIKALPVCNSINNAQKQAIDKEIIRFVKEYQYTYNLNYDILRKISNKLGASYILLITTTLDTETNFLKETIWNRLSIGGENSVNPSYKVITQITLIDPVNELILLEKNYDNLLTGKDFDLAMPTFSPAPNQLKKFQKLSIKIANNVTPIVESKILPELIPTENIFIEKVHFLKKQPSINIKPEVKAEILTPANINLNQNPKLKLFNYVEEDL